MCRLKHVKLFIEKRKGTNAQTFHTFLSKTPLPYSVHLVTYLAYFCYVRACALEVDILTAISIFASYLGKGLQNEPDYKSKRSIFSNIASYMCNYKLCNEY